MKTASAALRALLASRNFFAADLYTFNLAVTLPAPAVDNIRVADDGGTRLADDGSIRVSDAASTAAGVPVNTLYYTSFDRDIVANGNTYLSGGPGRPRFARYGGISQNGTCTWRRGLQVDTLQFDVDPGDALVGSMPFLTACRLGIFDGADVTLERAYMPTSGDTSEGTLILFGGRVAEVDAGRSAATFQIASHLELLNQQIPRNLYQAGCANSLFDASCGLKRAAFTVAGSVAAGSTSNTIATAALPQATGWFDLGVITFTSGANAGLSRTIKAYTSPGTFTLTSPLPAPPAAGDTFTVTPGCDKLNTTCGGKFANLARFKGAPFIPVAETAS